jgi:hypothetical protein
MQIVPYVPPVRQEVADQAQSWIADSPVQTQRTPPPTDSAPLTTEEVAAQDKAPDTVEDTLGVEAVRAIGIDPVASTGIHMEHATSAGEQQSHPMEETTELHHAEDTTRRKEN